MANKTFWKFSQLVHWCDWDLVCRLIISTWDAANNWDECFLRRGLEMERMKSHTTKLGKNSCFVIEFYCQKSCYMSLNGGKTSPHHSIRFALIRETRCCLLIHYCLDVGQQGNDVVAFPLTITRDESTSTKCHCNCGPRWPVSSTITTDRLMRESTCLNDKPNARISLLFDCEMRMRYGTRYWHHAESVIHRPGDWQF